MKRFSKPVFTAISLAFVVILAGLVRLECMQDDAWIDEYITGWVTAEGLGQAAIRARIANQTLPYTWLIYGMQQIFGNSIFTVRLPSLMSGMLSVVLVAFVAWRWTGVRLAAVVASLLAAIDPSFVFYASEGRAYAPAQLFGLLSIWALAEWIFPLETSNADNGAGQRPMDRGGAAQNLRWQILWTIAAIAMFYMHYTSAVVLAAQCIVGSIALSRSQAQRRPWLFCVAMVAVVCTPGLLDAARIGQRAVEWQAFSSLREYVASLKFAIAFSVTPFLIGLACSLFRSASNKVILGRGALVLGPMVGTIAMVWILVATDRAPLGHYRYSIAAVGASPVLCAIGLSAFRDVGLRCAFALIIGAAAFSQTNLAEHLAYRVLQPPMRFERWSEIVDRVNKDHARQHWALFVFPNLIEDRQMFDRQRFPDKSYFYAPLIVGNQLANSRQLMALPTWAEDRFRDSDIDSIVAAGGAGLIIRGGRSRATAPQSDLAASIMMELETKLSARGAFISFADASPPQSDVQLIWCPVSITQPTQ